MFGGVCRTWLRRRTPPLAPLVTQGVTSCLKTQSYPPAPPAALLPSPFGLFRVKKTAFSLRSVTHVEKSARKHPKVREMLANPVRVKVSLVTWRKQLEESLRNIPKSVKERQIQSKDLYSQQKSAREVLQKYPKVSETTNPVRKFKCLACAVVTWRKQPEKSSKNIPK